MNIRSVKDYGYYGMFHCPFRKDRNASFKVDYRKNVWYDFGASKGGTMIDLVMRMEHCSLAEAFQKLDDTSFSFQRDAPIVSINREPAIKIQHIAPLTHPALFDYLKERSVTTDIAKYYCSEIHYTIAGKNYFAIGFPNDAGGWELRNRTFKGSISPKNITTYNNGSDTVMVFEGFMDFLSYLSLKQNSSPTIDTAVLNSTANLSKAIPFLQYHKTVHAFLDNDEAGKRAVQSLYPVCKEVLDQSKLYADHKDLNDYLCNRSSMNRPVVKKNRGIKR